MPTSFFAVLGVTDEAPNPYAGRKNGEWIEGVISVLWLQEHFGEYDTAAEMKAATNSQGLKLYFDWLADQGVIPKE